MYSVLLAFYYTFFKLKLLKAAVLCTLLGVSSIELSIN